MALGYRDGAETAKTAVERGWSAVIGAIAGAALGWVLFSGTLQADGCATPATSHAGALGTTYWTCETVGGETRIFSSNPAFSPDPEMGLEIGKTIGALSVPAAIGSWLGWQLAKKRNDGAE